MISWALITIIFIISVKDLDNNHHLLTRMIEYFLCGLMLGFKICSI